MLAHRAQMHQADAVILSKIPQFTAAVLGGFVFGVGNFASIALVFALALIPVWNLGAARRRPGS